MRILVVDDEQLIRKQLKAKIISIMADAEIDISASNGQEALEVVKSFRPDVVFCDIKMPVMGGLEFSRLIREKFSQIAVVIVSGYADFSFAQNAIEYGVFNYLLKPLDTGKLGETLENLKIQHSFSENRPIIQNGDYRVCFLNFGNLYPKDGREKLHDSFSLYLQEHEIKDLFPASYFPSFVLQEGFHPNQRSVIYKAAAINRDSLELDRIIRESYGNLPSSLTLTTAFSDKIISSQNISVSIQRLRNMVETLYVPCREATYLLERDETSQKSDVFVVDLIRRGSSVIFNHQHNIPGKLSQMFEGMFDIHLPQIQMYSIVEKWIESLLSERRVFSDKTIYQQILKFETSFALSAEYEQIILDFRNMVESLSYRLNHEDSSYAYEKIITYVDENFARILSIRDVATVFSYNEAYLSRLFKNITGRNFITYITDKKIELARKLMNEDADISVSTVSEIIGYMDQLYFSRVFKNKVGMSPSMYKNRNIK